MPIPYQLECTVVLLQSLHALFQLLTTGSTLQHCPQAAGFAVALGTAARQDNGHIVSMASSLALAFRSGRSTLAVAGVFGAGKTRSLTFLLAWLALTTHLKIAVARKENPAGRAITKLLTAVDLEPDHQRYFIRPVSREEAETNTACTTYDLRASDAASYIPGCHVVIATTGLVWDQKGQTHSALNTHMENVDLLISEEAQQDMDLKSAFAPTVPRQPFFRLLLGDPKQSPGGVADGQRAHRTLLLKAPIGLRAPTTWYMPHEIPGVFHMLLRQCRGFGLSDLEETANAVGHRPLGSNWFRPEKVKATSSFACQLQSTYKDLSRVDLDLPEGLLVGLGYAATSPDSPLDFRQAQNAAERSGVASPHRWSLMLPTSARVAQDMYEPLIGIQYPMLCSRMGDTWQIGTTSIREDHLIASGLRFVHWCHASPNVQARHNPKNDPTVRVYQHLEDQLTKAGADTDDILALTTTREGATNLRNYFTIADKKANAETAVKVAGATAKHCIVIHGVSTFLSGEGHNLDYDQECFTRANVAYSRATDLTILACPLNMQGMPGALQVLAALLHGVQTIYTYDGNREPVIFGSLDLTAAQVAQATIFFQQALLPHPMWLGPLPVCLAEYHQGKVRRLRLVLAALTHLTKAEIASLREGPHLPGGTVLHDLVYGYAVDTSLEPEWLVITDGQQPGHWRLLHNSFDAARTAREADGQSVPLPSLQTYSDLPREWPMARLAISNKQIKRLVRTFLWRRVTEQALHGSSFVDIPDEINQAYIGDLLRICEAFAAPLSNLFAFVKGGHPACPFITHKQLALYANPRFWQYGLLAFIARCCSFDNQHRHQGTETAQAVEEKPQKTKEKDVDALTFMQTVIMSFVRGMEHGEQTLPTNDLFVYLPVQILPDLVVAMERQGFTPAEVKGGYGYRPKEEGAEDNPLLVVGVHTKEIAYDRYPRMPDTSWAERAYSSGALDPSLGQAFSFPSLLQLRLRIEVPLWRDLATARHPAADLPAEEDSASDATGSAERSPRLALPVPVGLAEPPEADTEEATEDEDMAAEPNYAFAKGYGRFGIGYSRLATALGNFEQGNIHAEGTVVAQWLTSGLRIAMSRTGWNLLSPRFMLTKVPSDTLTNYYCHGYPFTPKMEDRPYNQYGPLLYSEGRWDQLCAWLTGNSKFRSQLAGHKQALRDHMGYSQEAADPSNKARRTAPPPGAASSSSAAGSSYHGRPPPPPTPYGWWQ